MSTYQGVPIRRLSPGEGGADRQVVWRTRIARDLYQPRSLADLQAQGPTLVQRVEQEVAATSSPPDLRRSAVPCFASYVAARAHYERQRGERAGYWCAVQDILRQALQRGIDALTPKQVAVLDAAKVQAQKWIARQAKEEPE